MGVEVTVKKGTILLCIWNNNGDMSVVFLLHKCMGAADFKYYKSPMVLIAKYYKSPVEKC